MFVSFAQLITVTVLFCDYLGKYSSKMKMLTRLYQDFGLAHNGSNDLNIIKINGSFFRISGSSVFTPALTRGKFNGTSQADSLSLQWVI